LDQSGKAVLHIAEQTRDHRPFRSHLKQKACVTTRPHQASIKFCFVCIANMPSSDLYRSMLDQQRATSPGSPADLNSFCTCHYSASTERPSCPSCLARQQRRMSQYSLPYRTSSTSRSMTPPPTEAIAARRSLDVAPASSRPHRPRSNFSPNGLSASFASDDVPGASLFPPSLTSAGRNASIGSTFSRSSSSISSSIDDLHALRKLSLDNPNARSPSATAATRTGSHSSAYSGTTPPDMRPLHAEYAPMAAGFARLRSNDSSTPETPWRGRARPGTELGARMFEGPA